MFKIEIPAKSRVVVVDDESVTRFHSLVLFDLWDQIRLDDFESLNDFDGVTKAIEQADVIFLDHDLGPTDTIEPLIRWMTDPNAHSLDPHVPIIIHSMNPPGATWMHKQLRDIGGFTNVNVIPVAWEFVDITGCVYRDG